MQTEELGSFGYSLNIVERAIGEKLQELWRHFFFLYRAFGLLIGVIHWSYAAIQ